jgi:hypothetical protein
MIFMLQRILRSPFIPMILFLLIIVFLVLSLMGSQTNQQQLARLPFWILMFLTFLWSILIRVHNRRYPENRINALGFIPSEFREVDEGQQWVTFRACRNVYIYYTFALPVVAGACFLFSHYDYVPLLSIGILGMGQYIVYWLTIRKLNQF